MKNALGKFHADAGPTEMAGAVAIAPHRQSMHDRIIILFVERGEAGYTDEELALAYSRFDARYVGGYRNSIGARRNELVADGMLANSGRTRPSRAGVPNIVWVLA